jgi:hypothetical protein
MLIATTQFLAELQNDVAWLIRQIRMQRPWNAMRDFQIRQDRRHKELTAVNSGELRKQLLKYQAMRDSSIPQTGEVLRRPLMQLTQLISR